VYDPLGRVRQVTDSAGHTMTFAYDGASVTRTDANNHATIFEYVAFGDPDDRRLVAVTDAQAHTTRYRYDVTGALTSVLGPGSDIERTWTLDGRGLVASDTQPESGTTTYTYDEGGNVKTITNANTQTTTFTYDENNRLTLPSPTALSVPWMKCADACTPVSRWNCSALRPNGISAPSRVVRS
jgi:YD repeat-containing protein